MELFSERVHILTVFFFVLLCILETQSRSTLSLNLPAPFANFANRDSKVQLKHYSGKRVRPDSIRMVYIHDQAVAVVELGPNKLLLNCELIEIRSPEEVFPSLGELQEIARPVTITFDEMLNLMKQCQQLEDILAHRKLNENTKNLTLDDEGRGILSNSPFTLLSGIIPGTKWCGTGDIAKDYYDLGAEASVDSCCRAHDLCPVKVRAYQQRYNLTNQSLYTKSHCKCDDILFDCLKNHPSPTAQIMGNIYFNLVQVPCLEDTKYGRRFRTARKNFG